MPDESDVEPEPGERDVHPAPDAAEQSPYREIAAEVREYLDGDSSGHDMHHAWRVFALADRIATTEGADREVVGAAALTHDIHRVVGDEVVHPETTLDRVREILEATPFPDANVEDVLHAVEVHDEYDYRGNPRPAESLEAEVLQDADNLDAMGAVGVARDFAFSGAIGNPLWAPADQPSGKSHIHDKLLKLREEMNTGAARELAEPRHRFLATFAERFEREWHGEE